MTDHLVYVSTLSTMSEALIREKTNKYINEIVDVLRRDFDFKGSGDFELNYVKNRDTYVGYCYLFLRHKEVAFVMMGRNPDGSERVASANEDTATSFSFEPNVDDWALDDENANIILLPPLVPAPADIGYNIFNKFSERYFADNLSTSSLVMMPPGFLQGDKTIPAFITPDMVKKRFLIYSSDSRFPEVSILRKDKAPQVVYINFKTGTLDALVAMTMARYPTFTDGTGKKHMFEIKQYNTDRNKRK